MGLRTSGPWQTSCFSEGLMQIVHRAMEFWKRRPARPRYALALAGGGVIGGMYEVGAMTALEERLHGSGRGFDLYVGCSARPRGAPLPPRGRRAPRVLHTLQED